MACFSIPFGIFRYTKVMHKRTLIVLALALFIIAGAFLAWQRFLQSKEPQPHSQTSPPQPQTPPVHPYVEQVFDAMPLRDKVASLFIVHTPGVDSAQLSSYISTYKSAGLIFMGDNIPDTITQLQAQIKPLTTDPQLPPFVAVDEEGDTVKRLGADTFAGPLTLRNLPPSATNTAFTQRSDLLKDIGFNLNFGIIADVTADPNSFIYQRVLGTTAQAASERVTQAVLASKGRTLSTIKHFPGHGETTTDSHTSIPVASTSYGDWQQRVALPFKAGVEAGADMVMFGHLRYQAIDQQPASLSKKWHGTLFSELGYSGVTITDDMLMLQDSGEAAFANPVNNAVSALAAGNDLLLYVLNHEGGNTMIDPNTLIDGVVGAINDGHLDQAAIENRVKKVLGLRHQLSVSH